MSSTTTTPRPPHVSRDFICGAGAGMIGIFVGHPLDTVKVHQQVSGTKPMTTIKYVFKTYGILGYYRGLLVPMVTNGTVISLIFGTYSTVLGWMVDKDRLRQNPGKSIQEVCTPLESFTGGLVGGFAVSFLATPIELVKVQMQVDGGKTMTSPVTCIQRIVAAKGPTGLFTGLTSTFARNVHAVGFYMMTYKTFSDLARQDARDKGKKSPDSIYLFLSGGVSGLVYWLVNMPMDRIKSQIQGAPLTKESKTKSMMDIARKIYAEGGLRGFYKGVSVVVIRAPPVSGAIFLSLEYLRYGWDFLADKLAF